MLWLIFSLLAAAALAPLVLTLRGDIEGSGGRDPAMTLHRDQLAELDCDLREGRIMLAEHASAKLEVQRRLLQVVSTTELVTTAGSRVPVLAVLFVVPMLALGFYAVGGSPGLLTIASDSAVKVRATEEAVLIRMFWERLAAMDPRTDQAHQGYVLLGNVEESRGNDAAAVAAWRIALQNQFDATLAVRAAEAATRAEGTISESSVALFRRALDEAPPNAPWRRSVEQRLAKQQPP